MKLNEAAKAALRDAGVSQAAWARANYPADGIWRGDACGCPDDRCIGYHHGENEECGCLRVLLAEQQAKRAEWRRSLRAAAAELAGPGRTGGGNG